MDVFRKSRTITRIEMTINKVRARRGTKSKQWYKVKKETRKVPKVNSTVLFAEKDNTVCKDIIAIL